MSWLNTQLSNLRSELDSLTNENGYQSPLEIVGIARRRAMRPIRYYGSQYPYALPISDSVLRANDTYISTLGWRPATMKLQTDIIDGEWEGLANKFDTQN